MAPGCHLAFDMEIDSSRFPVPIRYDNTPPYKRDVTQNRGEAQAYKEREEQVFASRFEDFLASPTFFMGSLASDLGPLCGIDVFCVGPSQRNDTDRGWGTWDMYERRRVWWRRWA